MSKNGSTLMRKPGHQTSQSALVLIHHQDQHSMKQATAMAQVIQTGDID